MGLFGVLLTPPRIGDIGGVEAHTLNLANQLSKSGISARVICADEKTGSLKGLSTKVGRLLLKTAFKVENTNITPALPLSLFGAKEEIFHTMIPTPWSADLSAVIAKIKKRKLIVTVHSDLYSPGLVGGILTRIYVNTFYRLVLYLADKIIIVNPDYKSTFLHTKHVLRHFDKKIEFIPNGVDTESFSQKLNKKFAESKRAGEIIFVSVLDEFHEFKGLKYLIDAMKLVVSKIPDAKLTVVGGGPLKEKYENYSKGLGLNKNINFLGAMPNSSLPKLFSKSSALVLPSVDTESFGIVLLEAMSCSIPVITTEYAGMRDEIIRKKTGFVVKSRSSELLAKAIIKVISEKQEAKVMGSNGRELVIEKYSWSKVADKTIRLYKEVLGE